MIEPISSQTGNYRYTLIKMVGIFSEYSGIGKTGDAFILFCYKEGILPNSPDQFLILSVKGSIKSESELVRVIDYILIQKVCKGGMLTGKIISSSEI